MVHGVTCSQNVSVRHLLSAKFKERRTVRFRIGHDTVSKQHNMSWSNYRRRRWIFRRIGHNMMPYLTQRSLAFFEFFVRPRVVVGKYLEIFHQWVGESTGLLKANWEMSLPTPLKIICRRREEKGKSCVSFWADQSAILMLLCCGSLQIMMTSH